MLKWGEMPVMPKPPKPMVWHLFFMPLFVSGVLAWFEHLFAAVIIVSCGLIIAIGTTTCKPFKHLVDQLATVLSSKVGKALTNLLLLPFYLLIMAPMAFLQGLSSNDPLQLKIDSQTKSYWQPAQKTDDYERPY